MNGINGLGVPASHLSRTVSMVDGIEEPYRCVKTIIPPNHHINRQYGINIEERKTYCYADGGIYASFSGKTFGNRPFEFAVSNRTGRNIYSDMSQYFEWLELTQNKNVPDLVLESIRHLENSKASSNIAGDNITEVQKPNLSIRKGHQSNEYEDLNFVETRLFPEHQLNRRYGIEKLLVLDNTETGERRLVLEGTTFKDRHFYESISTRTGKTIKDVLKRLAKTRYMYISDAVVNIGKCLTAIKK